MSLLASPRSIPMRLAGVLFSGMGAFTAGGHGWSLRSSRRNPVWEFLGYHGILWSSMESAGFTALRRIDELTRYKLKEGFAAALLPLRYQDFPFHCGSHVGLCAGFSDRDLGPSLAELWRAARSSASGHDRAALHRDGKRPGGARAFVRYR